MAKVPGLVRQGGTYWYRRRVPADLQAIFGKKELWLPLGAGDHAAKARAARAAAAKVDEQFLRARLSGKTGGATDGEPETASDIELRRLAVRLLWEKERVAAATVPSSPEAAQDFREWIATLRSPDHHELASLLGETVDAVKAHGVSVPLPSTRPVLGKELLEPGPLSPQLVQANDLVRRVYIEHHRRQLDRANGGHGEGAHDPLFAGVTASSPEIVVSPERAQTLLKVIRRFETDPTRQHLTESAEKKYRLPFRALREIAGDERPLSDISRADCVAVQELIASIPANVSKLKPYAKLKTMREIAALAAERGDKAMSAGNVRVAVQHLASFFNWAIDKGLISSNPATRLAPAKAKSEKKRRPFNVEELNVMLAGLPEWAESRNSGRFWVPLLGLFMGLRLGEIVWLHVQEVQEIAGKPMLRLWRTADRSLKTDGSERIVPIHAALIELGFLQRVATARKEGKRRVFDDLPGADQRQCVDLFQKRFAYWQKKVLKIDREGTSFHSLRHGFRDALTIAKAPNDVLRSLGGWARGGGVENQYGQGAQPDLLAETMARIEFHGLNWLDLKIDRLEH